MSDKSFGDYANRNIVKNSLLSTAVTGMSIEDLTHNAVLVPVAPHQGLITGSDQTGGTYTQTLANPENEVTNLPSGDSNCNILPPQVSISTHSYSLDSHTSREHERMPEKPCASVSKASSKSEDDFDVNEYFARLQGTRYVSAPLHTHQDPNANLTAVEDTLEEINLNDDKNVEVQQSLTADIAQNFSQLPNVLPHVASAVFSSFSNMWNMKSREQTPDDRATSYQDVHYNMSQPSSQFQGHHGSTYQDVQFQGSQVSLEQFQGSGSLSVAGGIPMMSPEDVVKEVAPPPKEPPVCGTTSFRLATKKKYAQIPGLSTRETQPMAFSPLQQNVPSYFIPKETNQTEIQNTIQFKNPPTEQKNSENLSANYDFFKVTDTMAATDHQPSIIMPIEQPKLFEEGESSQINLQNQVPVIPPPPMFSSQRRDSQSGKSVLPPSVARRIGSNQPVIKQQIVQPTFTDKILVPTFDTGAGLLEPSTETSTSGQMFAPSIKQEQIKPPLLTSQASSSIPMFAPSINQYSEQPKQPPPQSSQVPPSVPMFPPIVTQNAEQQNLPPPASQRPPIVPMFPPTISQHAEQQKLPLPPTPAPPRIPYAPSINRHSDQPQLPPPPQVPSSIPMFAPNINRELINPPPAQIHHPSANIAPDTQAQGILMIAPRINQRQEQSTEPYPAEMSQTLTAIEPALQAPPTIPMFNPNIIQFPTQKLQSSNIIEPPKASSKPVFSPLSHFEAPTNVLSIDTSSSMSSSEGALRQHTPPQNRQTIFPNTATNEKPTGPKQPMQPPKTVSASSFRMTKKRPQYYSGPIEGIGSISNSIKPVIPTVDSGTFQGAVFTPAQLQADVNAPTFDISKTEAVASYASLNTTNTSSSYTSQSAYPSYDATQRTSDYGLQYDTTFDLSRPSTESYEFREELKESKGFGIIGSLKSKLSSLDINKIQNTVTTFFDPGYNEAKNDAKGVQENESYQVPNQSNFEIFVPHVDQSLSYYNYQPNQSAYEQSYANQYNYSPQNPEQNISGHQSYPNYYTETFQSISQTSNISQDTSTDRAINTVTPKDDIPKPFEQVNSENLEISDKNTNTVPDVPFKFTENISPAILAPANEVEQEEILAPQKDIVIKKPETDSYKTISPNYRKTDVTNTTILPTLIPTSKPIIDSIFYPTNVSASETEDIAQNKFENKIFGAFSNIHADVHKEVNQAETFIKEHKSVKEKEEILKGDNLLQSLAKGEVPPILAVASVPLFGLSTIIADKTKDIERIEEKLFKTAEIDVMDRASSMSFFENLGSLPSQTRDSTTIVDKSPSFSFFEAAPIKKEAIGDVPSASYFTNNSKVGSEHGDVMLDRNVFENIGAKDFGLTKDIIGNEDTGILEPELVSELSICETCREVNKPEEKEIEIEDLTMHLVENITSPIQLANPVEVPFTEEENKDRVEFDAGQFEEISHITEETIEAIHVQSAAELLEDNDVKNTNHGWSVDDKFATGPLKQDYGYKVEANSIGFFGDSLFSNYVPTNASDELKAEFKHQDVLPRQMNIPSAPPAEEDSKSEEATLDVNSIELDAKDDFPLFEEFVIDPSETDDDKIEFKEIEKVEKSDLDSFTNRVEKFKKMEEVSEMEDQKMYIYYEKPVQPISLASYFDTGNFAADTHYKNTMSSPSLISIPPGFEEEFKKRLALAKAKDDAKIKEDIKTVPETHTQTKPTVSLSFSTAHSSYSTQSTFTSSVMPVGFNIEANISQIVDDKSTPTSGTYAAPAVPNISSIFCTPVEQSKPHLSVPRSQKIIGSGVKLPEESFSSAEGLPGPSSFPTSASPGPASEKWKKSETPEKTKIETTKEEPKLPDPMNFFATDTPAPVTDESFSRLASYFNSPNSPPKTDHAKSFFELSQSQNHYRHGIPDKYKEIMKDLTSVNNLAIQKDQTIRRVNYFTVEYDLIPEFSKGDNLDDTLDHDEECLNLLNNCGHCVNTILNKRFKVRKAVNETGSATNMPVEQSVDAQNTRNSVTVNLDELAVRGEADQGVGATTENRSNSDLSPVKHHWFYRVDIDDKSIWRGFSITDSRALETAYLSPDLNEHTVVPTDGGRFDVNVIGRIRIPVYWNEKPTNVRRCSWFYKGTTDARYVPYTELVAEKLEIEYNHGITTGDWHRRLCLPNGEVVVMHGPTVMVHFTHSDAFSSPPYFSFGKRVYRNPPKIRVSRDVPKKIDHLLFMVHGAGEHTYQKLKMQATSRPRVVRRGHEESEVEDAEPSNIDHLLLLCHGVGPACDMRFRSVEEVVEDFRTTSLQLIQSHYKNSYDSGVVSRVEVLPISWHATLHSGETGVDKRLAQITLDSIPRLRNFTNETVLDVLFYTSPVFCQTIVDTVCMELNRIYDIFKKRNPNFKGGVSLGGHSLGSVILYDLLCHQSSERASHQIKTHGKSFVAGSAGTGQSYVRYPRLRFKPEALYALGSPIAIFECIRGVESLGKEFELPTCRKFFNIFHPYDPIAYRIEPLINPLLRELKPYLIPHHKGRKRMHLELKDTMARVGADLKQKLFESLKSTWYKWKAQPAEGSLEKVVEAELENEPLCDENKENLAKELELSKPEMLGRLNSGRRVDYVLQEAPLEIINEYLFAMSSHVGYWESEDTMLLMLREIYSSLGIQPDSTVPQQSMTVERTKTEENKNIVHSDHPSTSSSAR